MPDPSSDPESGSRGPFRGAHALTQLAQVFLAVTGAATSIANLRQNRWLLALGVGVLVGSIVWHLYSRRRQRQRRAVQTPLSVPESSTAYLRGLLPFQSGDRLLGRDGDVASLLTRVEAPEFRFGYLSAEAGCGKTSLIRAGLLPKLEARGCLVALRRRRPRRSRAHPRSRLAA